MLNWTGRIREFFIPPDKILVERVLQKQCSSVGLFGGGDLGLAVYFRLREKGVEVSGWYDSKVKSEPCDFIDTKLFSPSLLIQHQPQWLLIASEAYAKEIKDNCLGSGFNGRFISL